MPEPAFQITRDEFLELQEKYRKLKHDINNSLAVIMAQSELAQRNPTYYERLAKTVLERGPAVVVQMQEFQTAIAEKLKSSAPPGA